ncbi:hypothetical protein BS50DRAFT_598574 [Corynespora cassiicola Philippines]|uniref:Something about silencing protein 4 domain-containing protein n=1 Tax=Corynespora cassiicola Philippines TaxID=1448308 RepID=A0A2T2NWF8_CORCC|nr:hypothetical protein BS50DRAFT_598574 [Corynespora cassiicola Philippines]
MATLSVQRRSSVAERRARQTNHHHLPHPHPHPQPHPHPPPRANSRKRRAHDDDDAPPGTRPPTKVTVTQPHGQLLRITNGVPTALAIDADQLPQGGVSTPATNGVLPAALNATPVRHHDKQDKQDKRSLRSHDGGSRLKSDLAIYFSNYDDIIAGIEKPPDLLEYNSPIYIIDEPLKPKPSDPSQPDPDPAPAPSPTSSRKSASPSPSPAQPLSSSSSSSTTSTTYQVLDYSTIARHVRQDSSDADPLADAVYFTQHRRAERKEKQLRNIEKERAMHEKVQLERLLDGLQGPDWLKVMGITGVTDGERRDWEPKRDYFVREVEALVDKFRVWKEEEKRLRAEKEAALAAREEDDEDEDDDTTSQSDGPSDVIKVNGAAKHAPTTDHTRPPRDPAEPPRPRRPPRPQGFLLPYQPPEPTTPFVSFFSKPHLRAAALGKHRHGRNASAFGLAIPEFEEHEFCLPEEYLDPAYLRDNARDRRRRKREREQRGATAATAATAAAAGK